mgnify:CR=1 FL=1
MKAVNNYIIITPIKEEKKTESGFIMQDDKAEFRYLKGEVVSVGEKTEAIKKHITDKLNSLKKVFNDQTLAFIEISLNLKKCQ